MCDDDEILVYVDKGRCYVIGKFVYFFINFLKFIVEIDIKVLFYILILG